jgi:hypothetical protein
MPPSSSSRWGKAFSSTISTCHPGRISSRLKPFANPGERLIQFCAIGSDEGHGEKESTLELSGVRRMSDPLELRDLHVQRPLAPLARRLRAQVLEDRLLELSVVWLIHGTHPTNELACRRRRIARAEGPLSRVAVGSRTLDHVVRTVNLSVFRRHPVLCRPRRSVGGERLADDGSSALPLWPPAHDGRRAGVQVPLTQHRLDRA